MATTTFTAASLIFVNIWLIALVSFGVVASAVILNILGATDASIIPSLAVSITCVSTRPPRPQNVNADGSSLPYHSST